MPETQLRLLPFGRPLVERFGAEFFRTVPRSPGVYLMHGAGRLLYVGKAKDLRNRVGSYRYVTERTSRKTVRLVHAVESISWETTSTEEAAFLRENELLRTHRPRFNRANTYPRRHPFIELRRNGTAVCLRLTLEQSEHCFGAFKANAHAAFAALIRLLWIDANKAGYGELPRQLIIARPPRDWSFHESSSCFDLLGDFLHGTSNELLRHFEVHSDPGTVFFQQFRAADMAVLTDFYARGPLRNRELLTRRGLNSACIPPEQLDDWTIAWQSTSGDSSPSCKPACGTVNPLSSNA